MSSKSTLSIASISEESAVVSLQRELRSLSGQIIEPHDIKIKVTGRIEGYTVMVLCAILLMADIRNGDFYVF